MEHPVVVSGLSPQASKILDPGSPIPLKMMAASGLAPLGPRDLVSVLYALSYNTDTALASKAKDSLTKLPDNVLIETLGQDLGGGVLDGIARIIAKNFKAIEKIILNQKSEDETIVWLTQTVTIEKLLETIAAGETRMLRCPAIIEALYMNKASRMSTVDRAVELAIRNGIELTGIPTFDEVKKAIAGELIAEPTEETSQDDQEFNSALLSDISKDVTEEEIEKLAEHEQADDEDTNKKFKTLESSLSGLSVSQKIRVAMLGNPSQRAILIRDSNKLVSMAVLKSPAINDSEVVRYSSARSLPEEAIRFVASKREWTKNYQVKLNLVNNPRCPLQDALRFLSHLRSNDVKALENSKDVPSTICNAAKQLRKKRRG